MRSVSSFLKILVPQYLTPDAPLPKCSITAEGPDMSGLHRQMLDELADIVVKPMLPHNKALLGAVSIRQHGRYWYKPAYCRVLLSTGGGTLPVHSNINVDLFWYPAITQRRM